MYNIEKHHHIAFQGQGPNLKKSLHVYLLKKKISFYKRLSTERVKKIGTEFRVCGEPPALS